jgi:conserved hypothetical protein TIGR02594
MTPNYLQNVPVPKHVGIALGYIGITEIPGVKSNPIILSWAKELGIGDIYTNDNTSWCALFASICLKKASRELPTPKDRYDYLRALKWQNLWNKVDPFREGVGDILIFKRTGGGHIGFYVGESQTTYFVLGGNQGNKVSIVEIQKSRCVAVRRPVYLNFKPQKVIVKATGQLSTNEA